MKRERKKVAWVCVLHMGCLLPILSASFWPFSVVNFDRFISGLRRDRPALGVSGKIRPSLGNLQRDPTAPMVFYGETDRPFGVSGKI